jgi:hypothetical protein
MKARRLMFILSLGMPLAGCSTYKGGTTDDYSTGIGSTERTPIPPVPTATPSFRPGMNREDPRDQFFKQSDPDPVTPPPSNTF